jgi:hypothetical protein
MVSRNLHAQDLGFNGRMAGLGNSAAALVRGTDALGINPALIMPEHPNNVSLSFIPLSFHAGTDFLDFGTYKQYFTGVEGDDGTREPYYLTESDKAAILSSFSGDLGQFAVSGNYRLFAITGGWNGLAFGLDITDRIGSNGAIPQSFVDFLFNGNAPGVTYDFSGLEFRSSWMRTYGVTVAKSLRLGRQNMPVSVGISAKLVHGYGYFGMERFDSKFVTDPDSFVVYGRANTLTQYAGIEWLDNASIYLIDLFPEPVGTGFGVDIGVHAQISPFLKAGASITDIGSVTWNRGTKKTEVDEYFTINDVSSSEQFDDLKARINGTETDIGSFSSSLPTALTVAAAYSIPHVFARDKSLHITGAIRNGFNSEPGNIEGIFAGLGVEYAPWENMPLRAGATFGGIQGICISAGVGIHIERFTLDIGTGNVFSAFTEGFTSTSFAITSHLGF